MAQGSFSQQISGSSQQQGRVTRSQRKQYADQQRIAQYKFQQDQKEAERLRNEVFIDKPNDPFTFEEYSQEYEKLNPNIRQFFSSPQAITEEKNRRIGVEKTKFQLQIEQAQARIIAIKQKIKEAEENYNNLSADRRVRDKDSHNRRIKNYENDLAEQQDIVNQASSKAGMIDQGLSADDIISYAEDYAGVRRSNRESRQKQKQQFNKELKAGNLDADLVKLGFKDGEQVDYNKFIAKVGDYNKDVAYLKQLQTWGGKVGFTNLPIFAQERLNPDAMKWQKDNPTEKLVFDGSGNVVAVESGSLGRSMSLSEYNQLASKTPDERYSEWQSTTKDKPIYLDAKAVDITLPFETRGTTNINAQTTKLYPLDVNRMGTAPESNNIFKNIGKKYNAFIQSTPDVSLSVGGGSLFGIGKYGFGKVPKFEVSTADIFDPASKWFENQLDTLYEKTIGKAPNKEKIDEQFQQEYQSRFESQYMKKIIYGEIDYETASKEFAESDTAKIISEKYGSAITEDTKGMTRLNKWLYGSGLVGLSLGKKVVDVIPRKTGDLVVKGALAVAGVGALKYIPKTANLGLSGGFFTYGTYKAFSPKSTPVEAGGGLITAGITGISLGYAGFKKWNSPVVKVKNIPKPKADLYSAGTIGSDIKAINKVVYSQQKLSQVATAGRRTIVTTWGREFLNKRIASWNNMKGRYNFGGIDINFKSMPKFSKFSNIYEGIPTQQRAIYGTDVFRNTRYKIAPSGYEKAMKKLMNYGYTKNQAKATLRFSAPTVTEQWLKSGYLNIKGDISASGKFVFQTKKPILVVNKKLGITTRGGKTITEVDKINRRIIEFNDKQLMEEVRIKASGYLSNGKVIAKKFGVQTSTSSAKVSDVKQGVEFIRNQGGIKLYKDPASYQDIFSVTKDSSSLMITPKKTKPIIEIMNNQRSYNLGRTTLFEKNIDQGKIITIQKGNKGAFSTDASPTASINKAIKKILGGKGSSFISDAKAVDPKVLGNQEVIKLTQQLKGEVIFDPIKPTNVASMPKVNLDQVTGLDMGIVGATAVQLRSSTKQSNNLRLELKEMTSLRLNQLNVQALKTNLKTNQATKTTQSLRFQTPNIELNLLNPRLNVPTITPPPFKSAKFIIFGANIDLKKKIKAKAKKRGIENFALLPDFTSRAIGLAPKEFGSVKDAMREIKMLQTGFGIRRGGRIKGFSPVDEKSLMRGIMK